MRTLLPFLGILFLTACAATPTAEEETGPLKIGYIGPLTGDAASYGSDTVNGARIAVDEINKEGGVNGHPVSLIAEDARCTGSDAASAAQKLINIDNVVAIIGGQCSGETLAAAPVAEAAEVPMISPVSSSPDVTQAGDFIFRVYPSDALKGSALATYFAKEGLKKVAIISENTDFCIGIRDAVKGSLKEGGELVFDELVEPGTKDYRSLITRLAGTDFDVFVANGQSDATVAAMMQQLREMGITQPAIGTDTADSVTLGQVAKDAVEGMRVLSVPSLSGSDPKGGPFVQDFRSRFGEAQSTMFFAALSYEATRLLLETIGSAGPEGTAIRDALYSHPGYGSIVGTMTFDQYGDIRGIPYALKEFQNGNLVEVEQIPLN
jgi:branched-chain amino acid transport system substrate-binding protein